MKIIYIYNMESEVERNALERLRNELGLYIAAEHDYQTVLHIIPVRTTPAFIILRDDLQGDELLDGDVQLKITMEAYKSIEEEDLKIYQKESNRLDYMVNIEKLKAVEEFKKELKAELTQSESAALPQSVKDKIGI